MSHGDCLPNKSSTHGVNCVKWAKSNAQNSSSAVNDQLDCSPNFTINSFRTWASERGRSELCYELSNAFAFLEHPPDIVSASEHSSDISRTVGTLFLANTDIDQYSKRLVKAEVTLAI